MKIEREKYGITKFGEQVDCITIKNEAGFEVSVISYGATLISVKCPDRNGIASEITLGKPDLASYEAGHPYFGSTIGRFGNRIAGASFSLDGTDYRLEANNGPNCLHGGPLGFDKQIWWAFPFKEDKKAGVKLTCRSIDGEEGFPGNLEVSTVYTLTENSELLLDYEAFSDKSTPINLTNHTYWNFADPESEKVLEHRVQLNCSRYLPVDDVQIPLGELKPVAGTPFDFSEEKAIGRDIEEAGGYDHCWVTPVYKEGIDGMGSEDLADDLEQNDPFAIVSEPRSGRKAEFFTSQPGVQFYTGNFLNKVSGRSGVYDKHSGFCLETQNFPDAPNRPEFPSSILKPGKKYIHRTKIRFSTT